MAETTGIIHTLSVHQGGVLACASIGATAANAEVLVVSHDGSPASLAFATNAVQTLISAAANYRPVTAVHGNEDAIITSLRMETI